MGDGERDMQRTSGPCHSSMAGRGQKSYDLQNRLSKEGKEQNLGHCNKNVIVVLTAVRSNNCNQS